MQVWSSGGTGTLGSQIDPPPHSISGCIHVRCMVRSTAQARLRFWQEWAAASSPAATLLEPASLGLRPEVKTRSSARATARAHRQPQLYTIGWTRKLNFDQTLPGGQAVKALSSCVPCWMPKSTAACR